MLYTHFIIIAVILSGSLLPVGLQVAHAAPVPPPWVYHPKEGGGFEITDPINAVFYGHGKAWWIEALLRVTRNWDPTQVCATPAYLDSGLSDAQDAQLEHPPDRGCIPFAERYHLRIWDMGRASEWEWWAVGGVHLERLEPCTKPPFFLCHTIVDNGWERAEQFLMDVFTADPPGPGVPLSTSVSRIQIDNSVENLQGSANDGNAAFIKVPDPPPPPRPYRQGFSYCGTGRDPSCILLSPYLSSFNGTDWHKDDNVMPFSEGMGGVEALDYYRVQGPMVETVNGYKLLLSEEGTELSYFDRVRLLIVNHSANTKLAVSTYGRSFTYLNPNPPLAAVDSTEASHTSVLSQADEVYYQGSSQTYVTLDFGGVNASYGTRLLVEAECRLCRTPIYVQIRDATGAWQNITMSVPRAFWYLEAVDLSGFLPDPFGEFKVRLLFSGDQRVDYVGLDASEQEPITIVEAGLVQAIHSFYGNVTTTLNMSDDYYADIVRGDKLELLFQAPSSTPGLREFIFVSEGYVVS